MRTLAFTATLAVLLGGGLPAAATDVMGLFFDDSTFDEESTRVDTTPGQPFSAYVVLLDASPGTIGGYELGITLSSSTVNAMSVEGPNGWTNFGDNLNHLVGYVTPLPAGGGGTVLCTLRLMQMDGSEVRIEFGPSSPSSMSTGTPVIADGADPEQLLACELYGGGPEVAALNVPPPERREVPLSHVKSLFQ